MRFIILILFPTLLFSGFKEVSEDSLYLYKEAKLKKADFYKVKKKKKSSIKALEEILIRDQKIHDLLKRQEKNVIVKRSGNKITALTRVRGILLNSVLAMNVKPAKFIVRVKGDSHDIENAELRCLGFSFEKRIPAKCDLLVLDKEEFQVNADIWDLDGADGIIADYYYTGEEKTFLTSSFASFLGATFSVAKGGFNTPVGNVNQNTSKNKIVDGLLGISDNAKQAINQSGDKNITISYVNSGKEVLIFFNKSLDLNKVK